MNIETRDFRRYKALHEGIVVNRVSPRNTSKECPTAVGHSLVTKAWLSLSARPVASKT
ncbi:zinc ribbon domain-containing protein [Acididesulfobacillus acetoxydans]|uniref:zinc ribbon domain-containing protein n=1 Tax=Acididesulfobacillus acetoxydans TaxID=1561005 RepID=UPI003B84899A